MAQGQFCADRAQAENTGDSPAMFGKMQVAAIDGESRRHNLDDVAWELAYDEDGGMGFYEEPNSGQAGDVLSLRPSP